MGKMKSLCIMKDIYKAISEFEVSFEQVHGVSLNEAMTLCTIGDSTLSASVIAEQTGLSASHSSKVLRSIEEKELIQRALGDRDKRQMYFSLSEEGRNRLEGMQCGTVSIPKILQPVFEKMGCGDNSVSE